MKWCLEDNILCIRWKCCLWLLRWLVVIDCVFLLVIIGVMVWWWDFVFVVVFFFWGLLVDEFEGWGGVDEIDSIVECEEGGIKLIWYWVVDVLS